MLFWKKKVPVTHADRIREIADAARKVLVDEGNTKDLATCEALWAETSERIAQAAELGHRQICGVHFVWMGHVGQTFLAKHGYKADCGKYSGPYISWY